jgi:hypothetical protein
MSTEAITGAQWAFEEITEDAICAYIRGLVPGTVDVRPALSARQIQDPCVVVYVETSDNAGDNGIASGSREFSGSIHMRTPGRVEKRDGAEIASARQRHAELKSAILSGLFLEDGDEQPYVVLAREVNAAGVVGVVLQSLTPAGLTRDADAADNLIVTVLAFDGIGYPTGRA